MSFQIRFNLPEIATESLIKFIKLLLTEICGSKFDTFLNSLYMVKKELNLKDNFCFFAACPNCHKLYNNKEVKEYKENERIAIMKCNHVEFSNSATRKNHLYNTLLVKEVSVINGIKLKVKLIFPFSRIQQQLVILYNYPNFKIYLNIR